ncbi:MAG TPA: glycoside hydrolase family 99-like domain-containing protein [Candidatus Acidoferrales bacterium]|nr:glycoside hydrolase family 99-like domain-containing protein [Candidatus Acidoferrales bacterium]
MRPKSSFRPVLKWTAAILFVSLAAPLSRGSEQTYQTNSPATARAGHEVLAFYYPWYGPSRHWGKVDPARHDIEASRDYPLKGAYDSHDPGIIAWQISAAQKHGITGFIASWWGQGTYEDQAVPLLLEAAGQKDFKVTIYWETAPGKASEQIDNAVNDLVYLVTRYGTNRAFLRTDGKPVIFVYGRVLEQVPSSAWPEIISRARAKAGDFLLIADGYSARNAAVFDGLHTYNICGSVKGKTPDELRAWAATHYGEAVKLAREHHRIACVTVIPGYDDTKIRKPGLKADRLNGRVYRVLWDEAILAKPDWVLITSWNEWHEGSEIEPSLQYGDQYLRITDNGALRFRNGGN